MVSNVGASSEDGIQGSVERVKESGLKRVFRISRLAHLYRPELAYIDVE